LHKMKRILALMLAIIILLPFAVIQMQTAQALDANDLAEYINTNIAGLIATVSGATVTVTGTAIRNTTLYLDISTGVVLDWQGNLTGSVKGAFLLNISGSGIFIFTSGIINNTGTGGQILVEGVGATVNIVGSLSTTSNGISLNVSANDVTVNITGEIVNNGSNSAINVSPGNTGVKINVIGGTVESTPGGYAINDGSAEPPCINTTQIVINNGIIKSSSACAIRSSGIGSTVTVSGSSEISNAAGSNTNSTIYMNGDYGNPTDINIIIEDNSRVFTDNLTSGTSYVVQTTRSVLVKDSAIVSANAGRAINLVGMNSVAIIQDNAIVETVSGTAVCTATTIPLSVANASIVVTGGIVRATGTGTAVRITGANSTVSISGGWVTAKQGMAIDASGSPSINSVEVTGGFVFAWGATENKVVSPISKLDLKSEGIVVAWNTTTGEGIYHQNSTTDLSADPSGSVQWDNDPPGSNNGGIRYAYLTNVGFYPLAPDVDVINDLYTLTVVNGTDTTSSGPYPVGAIITVEADPEIPINPSIVGPAPDSLTNYPINGNAFSRWETSDGGVFINNIATSTSFIMPANDVTITACFEDRYRFSIQNGSIISPINYGSSTSYGFYSEGTEIIIRASSSFGPYFFNGWNQNDYSLATDRYSLVTTFIMPARIASIGVLPGSSTYPTPTQKSIQTINGIITTTGAGLLINNSTGTFLYGTGLNLKADTPAPQYIFDKWIIVTGDGGFVDATDPNTRFIMPDMHTIIEATYKRITPTYTLTVIDGADLTNAGVYSADDEVHIAANTAQTGRIFSGWLIDSGGGVFRDSSSNDTDFIMPDCSAVISAHYEYDSTLYSLTVINGIDGMFLGSYAYGDQITIIADDPPAGMNFTRWTADLSGGIFADSRNTITTFTMPAGDVTVTANYARPGGNTGGSSGSGDTGETGDTEESDETDEPGGSTENPSSTSDSNPIDVVLRANKIVSGTGAILDGIQFDFAIYDDNDTLISYGSNDVNGYIEFAPISFTEEGRYTFKAMETSQNGDGWITDNREFVITVTVTLEKGELKATIQNQGGAIPAFHNRYSAALASSDTTSASTITPSIPTPFIEDHFAYISGYPDGTVHPGSDITRAEVAMVFHRLLSEELLEADSGEAVQFSDVDPNRWYSTAVTVMHNLGIINGYPDGTFRPDAAITRAELATVAAHFATMMHMSPAVHVNFSDIEEHWAQLDILYAAKIGWLNGYPDGSFMPLRNITRGEFISLVNRVLHRTPESPDDLLEGMKTWSDNSDPSAWYYLAIQEATNSHTHGYKHQLTRDSDVQYEYWVELIN